MLQPSDLLVRVWETARIRSHRRSLLPRVTATGLARSARAALGATTAPAPPVGPRLPFHDPRLPREKLSPQSVAITSQDAAVPRTPGGPPPRGPSPVGCRSWKAAPSLWSRARPAARPEVRPSPACLRHRTRSAWHRHDQRREADGLRSARRCRLQRARQPGRRASDQAHGRTGSVDQLSHDRHDFRAGVRRWQLGERPARAPVDVERSRRRAAVELT